MAGLGGLALVLPAALANCADSTSPMPPSTRLSRTIGPNDAVTLDFSSDIGVANYAYALEQLEARFYNIVTDNPASDLLAGELAILNDIRAHESVHRDFLRVYLGAAAIPKLTFDFSSVDFTSRASVLATSRVFEDLGVAAYNGAGELLTDPQNLLLAGKIVSVEARHAAAIRDLIDPRSRFFAGDDVIDANGLDRAFDPLTVLAAADPYIVNPINVVGLP
ncbi:MAG: ferritin-like domain-containing protein [Anaerolineae bacterium]|nr:ferritin-like domain-containing protein [Gemmatimonadaceae bacterium]